VGRASADLPGAVGRCAVGYARRFVTRASGRHNVEIKARASDPAGARIRAASLATEHVGVDHQVDTYFRVPRGRLKLRESSLSGAQLVPYLRPDEPGPKRSDYQIVPVEDPVRLTALLAAILGVHRVVRKRREIWRVGNVRIHLDEVEGLGSFLELEAVFDGTPAAEIRERKKVADLLVALGLREADLVAGSYETLLGEAG
jgi:adenylate cyclase, class 2